MFEELNIGYMLDLSCCVLAHQGAHNLSPLIYLNLMFYSIKKHDTVMTQSDIEIDLDDGTPYFFQLLHQPRRWQNGICCNHKAHPFRGGCVYEGTCYLTVYIFLVRVILTPFAFPVLEADLLMKRLENKVFRAMQTAGSPLHEPALAAILVKKKRSAKAKARYDANGSNTNLLESSLTVFSTIGHDQRALGLY